MIYLDQAATSYPKPAAVIEAVCSALATAGNSGRGVHGMSLAASRLIYQARWELAEFFGASDPSQIAFSANATESLNMALLGLLEPGDHVVTTELEHNSVLRPLYLLQKRGVEVTVLPADYQGRVDFSALAAASQPNTKAVVCTHASNVTGNVIDLDYVLDFCQRQRLVSIIDGAQTAGWYPYNLTKQPIDILCFTGHKALLGPQGVGGIYVRPGLKLRPLKTGGSGIKTFSKTHPETMPEALEAGTLNTPGVAGLAAGVRYLREVGLAHVRKVEGELTQFFFAEVKEIPGVTVYGDFTDQERCPIVALNIAGVDSSFLSQLLAEKYNIATRSGGHCAPLMHRALQTDKTGLVRFSFSHFNSKAELEVAVQAMAEISEEYGPEGDG